MAKIECSFKIGKQTPFFLGGGVPFILPAMIHTSDISIGKFRASMKIGWKVDVVGHVLPQYKILFFFSDRVLVLCQILFNALPEQKHD